MYKKALAICGLLTLTVLPADGGEPLDISATPAVTFAPGTLRIRTRVEPNLNNRVLAIVADSEDFYRESEIPLDGDRAERVVEVQFGAVPSGDYVIYAVLTDASGQQHVSRRITAQVLSNR